MTIQPIADLDGLKTRIRATWMAGDYSSVAALTESAANDFIDRRQIKPNMQVLDVACGNGNLSIPAAKAGAAVTGVDISPNLLDQARARATREKLNIRFEEGDAENLPVAAGAFDLIVSMFGAIFAPRPDLVAAELRRVCRSGGQIAMAETFDGNKLLVGCNDAHIMSVFDLNAMQPLTPVDTGSNLGLSYQFEY